MDVTHLKLQQPLVSKDDPPGEVGVSQKETSPNSEKKPTAQASPPVVAITEAVPEEHGLQAAINDHRGAASLNSDSLAPSGPPDSPRRFSLQDFKRSFYDEWMKDKSIEKSDPFGFHSTNASRSHSRSQSPSPISYAQGVARRGSLSGGQN